MTPLLKVLHRVSNVVLGGRYGPDRGRKIVVTLVPGGVGRPDQIVLRPQGTRRGEVLNVDDAYELATKKRADREWAVRMAEKKARKAARLASRRIARADRKLRAEIREVAA